MLEVETRSAKRAFWTSAAEADCRLLLRGDWGPRVFRSIMILNLVFCTAVKRRYFETIKLELDRGRRLCARCLIIWPGWGNLTSCIPGAFSIIPAR